MVSHLSILILSGHVCDAVVRASILLFNINDITSTSMLRKAWYRIPPWNFYLLVLFQQRWIVSRLIIFRRCASWCIGCSRLSSGDNMSVSTWPLILNGIITQNSNQSYLKYQWSPADSIAVITDCRDQWLTPSPMATVFHGRGNKHIYPIHLIWIVVRYKSPVW